MESAGGLSGERSAPLLEAQADVPASLWELRG